MGILSLSVCGFQRDRHNYDRRVPFPQRHGALLAENCPVPVVRHGVEDTFGRSGTANAVLEYYGLTPEVLADKCRKAVAMKK